MLKLLGLFNKGFRSYWGAETSTRHLVTKNNQLFGPWQANFPLFLVYKLIMITMAPCLAQVREAVSVFLPLPFNLKHKIVNSISFKLLL